MELLYSEKKPGDLASRQCIVEILNGLFDVSSDVASRPVCQDDWRKPWSSRESFGASQDQNRSSSEASHSRLSTNTSGKSPQLPDLQFDRRANKGSDGSSTWESAGFNEDYSFASGSTHPANRARQLTSDSASLKQSNASLAYPLVRSLVIGPPNEKEEAQVYFIKSTRKIRVFKLWMDEVIGVLSDYFW